MKVRITKNEPTSAQKKVLMQEFDKLLVNLNRDVYVQLLHFFRFKRGYGKKRLKVLANDLKDTLDGIHARYELSESDTVWICEKQLKESGINVDDLLGENK
jgi:hypothetical protein